MSSYGDDIRRIANYKKTKDPDAEKPPTAKPALSGTRGIAYYDASGTVTTSTSTPGTDNLLDDIASLFSDNITDAWFEVKGQLGLEGEDGDADPAGEEGIIQANGEVSDESEVPVDIEDLLDATDTDSTTDLLPTLENPLANYDSINILTGMTDPAIGDSFIARFDGNYTPPRADDTGPYPTPAWFNVNYPPEDPGWIQGGFFVVGWSGGSQLCATASQAIDAAQACTPFAGAFIEFHPSLGTFPGEAPSAAHLATLPPGNNGNIVYVPKFQDVNDPMNFFVQSFSMFRCDKSVPTPGSGDVCLAANPGVHRFPASKETEFALKIDGLWKTSGYDLSNISKRYPNGLSTIVFRFSEGTRIGVIEPGVDGSHLIYEIDEGGNPISDIRQYNQNKYILQRKQGILTKQSRTLQAIIKAEDINTVRVPRSGGTIIRVPALDS